MKSLHKVYKSANVTLGQKKSIDYTPKVIPIIPETVEDEIDHESELQNRIQEVEQECQNLLEQAQSEANLILAEAYEDSKRILEKAQEEGYNEGFELGRSEGLKLYTVAIDEAKQLKQDVYKFKKDVANQLEKDIVQLVIESVKKIIQHELEEDNELILNVIRIAIDKCTFTECLTIRVSEEDFETVNQSVNRIYMMTEGIDKIEIKCDKYLKPGSVVIDTLSGKIDASIETQIRQVENAFNELLKSE